MSDYGIAAINTIAKNLVSDLDYASTEVGTIVDVALAQNGIYTVKVNGTTYNAYSSIQNLLLGDKVLVVKSNNSINPIQTIISKVEGESENIDEVSNITFFSKQSLTGISSNPDIEAQSASIIQPISIFDYNKLLQNANYADEIINYLIIPEPCLKKPLVINLEAILQININDINKLSNAKIQIQFYQSYDDPCKNGLFEFPLLRFLSGNIENNRYILPVQYNIQFYVNKNWLFFDNIYFTISLVENNNIIPFIPKKYIFKIGTFESNKYPILLYKKEANNTLIFLDSTFYNNDINPFNELTIQPRLCSFIDFDEWIEGKEVSDYKSDFQEKIINAPNNKNYNYYISRDNEPYKTNSNGNKIIFNWDYFEKYSLYISVEDNNIVNKSNIITFMTQDAINTKEANDFGYTLSVPKTIYPIYTGYNSIAPQVYESGEYKDSISLMYNGNTVNSRNISSIEWWVDEENSQLWLEKFDNNEENNTRKYPKPYFIIENSQDTTINFQFFDRYMFDSTDIHCKVILPNNQELKLKTRLYSTYYEELLNENNLLPRARLDKGVYPIKSINNLTDSIEFPLTTSLFDINTQQEFSIKNNDKYLYYHSTRTDISPRELQFYKLKENEDGKEAFEQQTSLSSNLISQYYEHIGDKHGGILDLKIGEIDSTNSLLFISGTETENISSENLIAGNIIIPESKNGIQFNLSSINSKLVWSNSKFLIIEVPITHYLNYSLESENKRSLDMEPIEGKTYQDLNGKPVSKVDSTSAYCIASNNIYKKTSDIEVDVHKIYYEFLPFTATSNGNIDIPGTIYQLTEQNIFKSIKEENVIGGQVYYSWTKKEKGTLSKFNQRRLYGEHIKSYQRILQADYNTIKTRLQHQVNENQNPAINDDYPDRGQYNLNNIYYFTPVNNRDISTEDKNGQIDDFPEYYIQIGDSYIQTMSQQNIPGVQYYQKNQVLESDTYIYTYTLDDGTPRDLSNLNKDNVSFFYENIPLAQPPEAFNFTIIQYFFIVPNTRSGLIMNPSKLTILSNNSDGIGTDWFLSKQLEQYGGLYKYFANYQYGNKCFPPVEYAYNINSVNNTVGNYIQPKQVIPTKMNLLIEKINEIKSAEEDNASTDGGENAAPMGKNLMSTNKFNLLKTETYDANIFSNALNYPFQLIKKSLPVLQNQIDNTYVWLAQKEKEIDDLLFTPRYSVNEKKLSNGQHISTLAFWTNSPFQGQYFLPNCTCYAWGRYAEVAAHGNLANLTNGLNAARGLCTGNAGRWFTAAKGSSKFTGKVRTAQEFNDDPDKMKYRGSIMVWSGGDSGCGHVAVVEDIDITSSNYIIRCSQSNYSAREPDGLPYFCISERTKRAGYNIGHNFHFEGFILQ